MRKVCTTEYTAAREKQLEESLLALMQTRRYAEITVRDICEAAGIPRRAFYRYFDCKDDLLKALLDETIPEQLLGEFLTGRTKAELIDYFERFFTYWKSQQPFLAALQRGGVSNYLMVNTLDSVVRRENTLRPPDVKSWEWEKGTVFALVGLFTLLFDWQHNHFDHTPRQMAGMVVELFCNPILTCES